MKTKRLFALLLALMCILSAGCSQQGAEQGTAADVPGNDTAGSDWRTWGWVSDAGTIEMDHGEQTALLLCVFTENAVLYYDDAVQTEFAALRYPYALSDAQEAYASFSLLDQNGDGSPDVQLVFVHGDGTRTELTYCWDGEGFAYSSELSGSTGAESGQ